MTRRDRFLLLYLAFFYAAWIGAIGLEAYLQGTLVPRLGDPTINAMWWTGARLVLWLLPVYLYVTYREREHLGTYLSLTTNVRKGLLVGVLVSLLIPAVAVISRALGDNAVGAVQCYPTVLLAVFAPPIVEEVVFRGFLQRQLLQRTSFLKATLISSFLFGCIHLPGWYATGIPMFPFTLFRFASIMFLGVYLCYFNRLSGSLWTSIIYHSLTSLYYLGLPCIGL